MTSTGIFIAFMKAYTAQIIYRILCEGVSTEQYEEQWRLVMAASDEDALAAAREVAKEEESLFVDRHGRTINWKLVAVKDIQPISLEHGTLLFSTVKEAAVVADPLWTE